MKLCLIPPKGLENFALHSDVHLTLAQIANVAYLDTYAKAASRGDYIIVDNGAAEGQMVGDYALLTAAKNFGAKEIVLPDIMHSSSGTVDRIYKFWRNERARTREQGKVGIDQYMAVAQGTSLEEVKSVIRVWEGESRITAIGLPRHLVTSVGQATRIDVANWMQDRFGSRFWIHFLGTNPHWPSEALYAAKYAGHVRSIDTSMPFNYAIAGCTLRKDSRPVNRPLDYFAKAYNVAPAQLWDNIETLMRWCNGQAS